MLTNQLVMHTAPGGAFPPFAASNTTPSANNHTTRMKSLLGARVCEFLFVGSKQPKHVQMLLL